MDLEKLLKEKCIHSFRKGYITVEGYTLTEKYGELKNDLDNLEVNEDDVWVCTFPKTGTTWTQEMVWMITNNLDFEGARKLIDERSPFIDFSVVYDDPEHITPRFVYDSIGYYKSLQSPKVVKTHLPYDLLPKQIKSGAKKPKMIYVARDPRDTCVSFYHHCRLLEGFRGNLEEFCELFLGGKVMDGPFFEHIFSYWNQRDSPNLLFLRYEEMKKDLPGVIKKVSKFLDKSLSEDQVKILAKHLSFESMKKNQAVNREFLEDINKKFKLTDAVDGKFMRSGTVGGYKSSMSEEMAQRFDKWISEKLKGTDYHI